MIGTADFGREKRPTGGALLLGAEQALNTAGLRIRRTAPSSSTDSVLR